VPAGVESGTGSRVGAASRPWAHAVAIGAAMATVIMVVTSTGDIILLGALLGLAACDAVAGGVAILAGISVIGRWGTSSLAALAGGQAVVGAAGWTGSDLLVASSWCGALALLLVCPPGLAPAAAFGATAAQLVAGPALGEGSSAGAIALRILAPLGGMAGAIAMARLVPPSVARTVALAVGVAAAGLAFAA
jgi:hypothetical protein